MLTNRRPSFRSCFGAIIVAALFLTSCRFLSGPFGGTFKPFTTVESVSTNGSSLAEPFGVAIKEDVVFISDGLNGKIVRISGETVQDFAVGLNTPSAIAFAPDGSLVVADTGSHTIKKIGQDGRISVIAGTEGRPGDADGPASEALFNAPVGVSVFENGKIAVADTYNDKIKIINDGAVTTIAGSGRGFADGTGPNAKFNTPCGVSVWGDGSILVADTMNSRVRLISASGLVSTVAGNGEPAIVDGSLPEARFVRPNAITAGPDGSIFIADNNSLRQIRNSPFPVVETLTMKRRGFVDGPTGLAAFNRISGLAVNDDGYVYAADSDNGAVRKIYSARIVDLEKQEVIDRSRRTDASEFRIRQPARWPFDPPEARRDIAGTLGEIRGEYKGADSFVRFHNGLDIAGAYGETTRFLWDETVLDPLSAENFETLRELIRLPSIGYIHVRLGRDSSGRPLGDERFQFDPGMTGVRVRRGSRFRAGEPVGTLNAMNHVHMIAGPNGDEMNALGALLLPGVTDTIAPVIEETAIYDENWQPIETKSADGRNILTGKVRIVVRAFDRIDGNPERRRLGVFRLGYLLMKSEHWIRGDVSWTINFDRNPSPEAVKFAYAPQSKSGPTGETIFRYIVTNNVNGSSFSEGFFDPNGLEPGKWVVRVFAADYFGNTSAKDINFEVSK